ncbi:MAG: ribonuclease HI family protein, partial [Candidatus Omnitrophica bacterium]|nr:ribonuclease HI family protein [Candidatus Omnitrophota bacterium]
KELIIFTDGGSRGNPGPSAVGAVLFNKEGDIVEKISEYIGTATNNVAEYMAVIYGLQEAVYYGAEKVVLKLDSQLVARQLRGEYRVKDKHLKKFFGLAVNLLRGIKSVDIKEIPREKNKEADFLVNKALDREVLI